MSNRAREDKQIGTTSFRPAAGADDPKFRAASNVDRNEKGEVVNGPYVDPGSYANPDDDLPNVRKNDRDDGSLFVAADRTVAGNFVQPGVVESAPSIDGDTDD